MRTTIPWDEPYYYHVFFFFFLQVWKLKLGKVKSPIQGCQLVGGRAETSDLFTKMLPSLCFNIHY